MPFSRTWSWPGTAMLLLGVAAAVTAGDANGAEVFARVVVAMIVGLALGLASLVVASAFSPRKS